MMTQLQEFWPYVLFIAEGALVTLKYSFIAVFFGFVIGSILSLFKISHYKILQLFADFYTSIFRGTPLLMQLSIIYFATPQLCNIKISMLMAGLLAFSLNSGAYVSEIIRAGIKAVDVGQFEAAKALSIPYHLMMKDIILPQAIRKILPSLVNELINMVKESAIISVIGEMDLMRRAQLVAAEQYTYFAPMITAALCYYLIILILARLAKIIENRLAI